MHALIFDGELQYVDDYPVPSPGRGEALVRVTHCGICNTDIEITKGYMGFTGVPGHEFVGIVEKCEDSRLAGKRVVGEINIGCGSCELCRKYMQNHCFRRSVLGILNRDGAFAEYLTLPAGNLHEVPDSVPDEEAVFVEPLAAAFEVLEQVSISPSDKVCVLGDGKLGLLAAQALSTASDNLVAVGNHREKLSILDESGIQTRLSAKCQSKEFDIVVDCTGSPSGIRKALQIVKPLGKVILKTTTAKKSPLDLNQIVINEVSLIGSRCGPFPAAIKAILARQIDLYPLISDVFSLEEGIKAFKRASEKGALKVILRT